MAHVEVTVGRVAGVGVLWLACLIAACDSPSDPPAGPSVGPPVVRYALQASNVSREPRIAPPGPGEASRTAGWPEEGAEVRWVAHLQNRGSETARGVPWTWIEDGAVIDSGTVDMPPGASSVELRWQWTFERKELWFTLLVPDSLDDVTSADDAIEVVSDALTVGFWVEERIHDRLERRDWQGIERWAHDAVSGFDRILQRARYSTLTQSRVRDRLRLGHVTVVPDGSTYPEELDTDLVWFFADRVQDERFLKSYSPDPVVADQTIVLHELLHQRGLTDLYAYDVQHGSPNGSVVDILDNGVSVVGSPLMPLIGSTRVWLPDLNGLMGTEYFSDARVTEHTVYGMNIHAGWRTPRWRDEFGNHRNGFEEGHYVNTLAPQTVLRFTDAGTGEPLAGAMVDVFNDHTELHYQNTYREQPDLTLEADANGAVRLPRTILDGTVTLKYPRPWTLIVRVRRGALRTYLFLPGYRLNLPVFRGDPEPALSYPVTLR